MKRIIKGISLFSVILLSFIFGYPSRAFALTEQTYYVNIDSTQNLDVGSLSFSNILFKDYSTTSTQAFGLTGLVVNDSSRSIGYTLIVCYYDSNYNLIAQASNSATAVSGIGYFNQMSNLTILNGHSINEIYYYRISISIADTPSLEAEIVSSKTPSKNYQYSSYDYVIDKYDINIVVNENNTFDITETITAYFNVAKHGIFRTIPLKNTIKRLDGTTSTNRTQVTNISVNNEYTASRENGNYKLQIGSASKTITGEQTYVIKYIYNLGQDSVKNYDELYYNIIGNEWDTVIGNVTFSIIMPKEFDSSKLGFSSGIIGSTDNSKVKYNVSGNKISGNYDGILEVGEALTIRCELPEGYFVGASLSINFMDYIMLLTPLLFLAIAIFLWYKFGRDEQVVETVEFYPPAGFNSLEVGFLYKGQAGGQDVISLLIYLANNGYIKISETEEKSLFSSSKGFKITKLKEYDGNNINELIFLNGLFNKKTSYTSLFSKTSETSNNINEVTSMDLYDNFYITMDKILSNINNKENKDKIFEKSSLWKNPFIIIMIITTYFLITIPPIVTYGEPAFLLFALLSPGIGFTLMFNMLLNNDNATRSSIGTKLFGLIWGGIFGGMPWAIMVLPSLLQDAFYLIGYIIGLGCVFGMVACLKYLPKRTSYGNEMLGKLRGFRNFLETAEKEKLEAMVMQDPTYFYNILPYTYVLGVSDKWIKSFESISMQAPSWYDSPNAFDMVTFSSFMNNTMMAAQSAMSSSPSSDSDVGNSSGGGSSGGGSGGGGGGSW